MAESNADKLSRVRMMASGSETWDLSRNDIAALKYVLAALTAATERAERAEAESDALRTRLAAVEAERDRYRSALRDVAHEWPYLDLIDPQTAQECDLRRLVEYLLSAMRSEQRVAREALEGQSDA